MTSRQTLVRNTAWYGLVTVAGLAGGLLMSIVLARGLGPARMGDYSYLLWVMRTLTAVATLGFTLATTRYTADALAQGRPALGTAYLRWFARRQLATTAAVVAAALPLGAWLAPADLRWPLAVLIVGLFPTTMESVYAHAAYGAQRYDLTTQVSTLKITLNLAAATAAVLVGGDILGIMVGGVLATTLTGLIQRRRARALYPGRAEPIAEPARAELRAFLLPLSIVAVLDTIVWDRSEILFLRLHASPEEIAFYSVAFGLATRAMVAPQVILGALLPAMAALHGRGARREFDGVYQAAIRGVALVGTPVVAVVAAAAPALVVLLYGEPYLPVAALLGPLLAVALVGAARLVAWTALRATGDRRWALHATWISAVVNLALAALLIPRWGAWGAVAANAAAQLTASVLALAGVRRLRGCGFPVSDLARIAVAGVVGYLATRALVAGPAPAGPLIGAVAGLAAFAAVAVALGALGAREWELVTGAWPARPPRVVAALGLAAAAAVLYAPVARDLVVVWAGVPYYSYGFLVPPFSAYLAWTATRRLAEPAGLRWSGPGAGLLTLGLGVLVLGYRTASLTLQALSLPLALWGLARLLLGSEDARALRFPVAFLALMAPLPDAALPAVSLPLQQLAAWTAGHALAAAGVPAIREGLFLYLPGLTLHVGEACNGLRFLLAMLVMGTALAWTLDRRPLGRLAVVGLAAAVAIAANLVRVTGTGWLAHHYGPDAASGFLHLAYGKVVYLAMLLPFVAGVVLLRRRPRGRATPWMARRPAP